MIRVADSVNEPLRNSEKCLDPQLWHACAGGMVQMPAVHSKVYYFPQGHAEHANGNVDFRKFLIPPLVLCRVSGIKYMAAQETDEVYAKMLLVPLRENEYKDDDFNGNNGIENNEKKPASFAKTLTQSDANNGGGFSVPRYCAETIFPRLDYTADPPVQNILATDVHGNVWKFRHIYRGTPRRHLLTTGWGNFVNQKKLVAGDSIVFLRAENGDLRVGIRRAKKGIGSGHEYLPGWNLGGGNSGSRFWGCSPFLKEEERTLMRRNSDGYMSGRVRIDSVIEAATLAANGQPFEVIYYPRASTPEFCVKASSVRAAMQIQWCPGMRFKMAFETEDSSRISWFMGTISSVQVVDPIHWPTSLWRLLQVQWDEPDLLQNVKCVSPWLVELVSDIPPVHLNSFSPPRKKMRLPQQPDFLFNEFLVSSFSSNPLGSNSPLSCVTDNVPAGIQGARHAQFGLSSADLHINKLQEGLYSVGFQQLDRAAPHSRNLTKNLFCEKQNSGNTSHLLRIGNPPLSSEGKNAIKTPHILLFGKVIVTEQQSSQSCSGDTVGNSLSEGNTEKTGVSSDGFGSALPKNPLENSSDERSPWYKEHKKTDLDLETGHCKVFMESEDVGRTLDISVLGSYAELYQKLANMFGIENSEMLSGVLYLDTTGSVKHAGDEPFSEFLKTARRLTILTDYGSDNIGR
ncbi:hypothetical protein SLEP1_g42546 [Rubroshorea leprosula]|uniref:Auxin response factor n=1 Tax=Rubroshorea leprosula TaxID=152421 RepID=A0AAV5LA46_9ROSI|nr:hypothetical protein SLEP1_g42546 [Rubroshorea leprosula]